MITRRTLLKQCGYAALLAATSPFIMKSVRAQTTGFDYYISPTGSDSNAGTSVSAPWAITSLQNNNKNNSKMAGKRIGLMAGTYNIAGMKSGTQPTNYAYSVLAPPAGTAGSPTYIGSCDTSGAYKQGVAIITVGGGTIINAAIGQDQNAKGYWTLDGVTINGGGCDGHLVQGYYPSTGSLYTSGGTAPGITIQNCELYGIAASIVGNNEALIFLEGTLNAVVKNNYFHDVTKPSQADHAHAYEEYGTTGTQFIYNTVSNCCTGVDAKAGDSGTVVAYNYFYNTGLPVANASCAALTGFDGAEGNPNTPGTAYSIHHNIFDSCGSTNAGDINASNFTQAIEFYNNTIYNKMTSKKNIVFLRANAGLVQFYNNLVVSTAGSGAYQGLVGFNTGSCAICDYNGYALSSLTDAWGLDITTLYSTLSSWQASSGNPDVHAVVNSNPGFVGPQNMVPSSFLLASGSPYIGAGRVGGVASGAARNIGAWDGTVTQIGCSWGTLTCP